MIAGFSIVFEGQYSVGDFVHIKPQDISGVVEELGLRMTKIRSLSGEVSYIPNGTMQGVVNYVSGQQRFNVEVQVSDAEAASRVERALGEASELYLSPPRLVERSETDGRVRMRIVAGVLPSMAWLVEENLTQRIKAAAGEEALAAEPLDLQGGPGEPAQDKIPPAPGSRAKPATAGGQEALEASGASAVTCCAYSILPNVSHAKIVAVPDA